jgi:hypothetical protein
MMIRARTVPRQFVKGFPGQGLISFLLRGFFPVKQVFPSNADMGNTEKEPCVALLSFPYLQHWVQSGWALPPH